MTGASGALVRGSGQRLWSRALVAGSGQGLRSVRAVRAGLSLQRQCLTRSTAGAQGSACERVSGADALPRSGTPRGVPSGHYGDLWTRGVRSVRRSGKPGHSVPRSRGSRHSLGGIWSKLLDLSGFFGDDGGREVPRAGPAHPAGSSGPLLIGGCAARAQGAASPVRGLWLAGGDPAICECHADSATQTSVAQVRKDRIDRGAPRRGRSSCCAPAGHLGSEPARCEPARRDGETQ